MSQFTGSPAAVLRFMQAYGHEPPAFGAALQRWIEAFTRGEFDFPETSEDVDEWFARRDDYRERMTAALDTGFNRGGQGVVWADR